MEDSSRHATRYRCILRLAKQAEVERKDTGQASEHMQSRVVVAEKGRNYKVRPLIRGCDRLGLATPAPCHAHPCCTRGPLRERTSIELSLPQGHVCNFVSLLLQDLRPILSVLPPCVLSRSPLVSVPQCTNGYLPHRVQHLVLNKDHSLT